jgi:hypothetical protein
MTPLEHSKNVIGQTLIVVSGFGVAGSAESSPRYSIDMAGASEPLSEIIEHVRRVAGTSKQDDVPSRTAPVEEFQLDAIVHRYELYGMGRRITPKRRLSLGEPERGKSNKCDRCYPISDNGSVIHFISS